MAEPSSPKFTLGRIVSTRNALDTLHQEDVLAALQRHAAGDWGDLDQHDWRENEASVEGGFRLLSAYQDRHETRFWIITEADRSLTTVLLPEDY